MQFLVGLILACLVALAAYRVRALTANGAISACVLGALVFGTGGWRWGAALVMFFITSSALSRWRRRGKEALGFAKGGRRDAAQVWANGGVAGICALLALLRVWPTAYAHGLFLAALAAANADTWATEIGAALGGQPRDVRTGKPVRIGASGGVSVVGTMAALAGALLLGLFAGMHWLPVTLAGFAGALADSLLGATVQAQWQDPACPERLVETAPSETAQPLRGIAGMGNDSVNLLSTAIAAGLCAFLLNR